MIRKRQELVWLVSRKRKDNKEYTYLEPYCIFKEKQLAMEFTDENNARDKMYSYVCCPWELI